MTFFNWLHRIKSGGSGQVAPPSIPNAKKMSRKAASNELVKYGEDMANANKPEEALKCFEKAIEIYPQSDVAWGDKGLILDKLGEVEKALESFSKATDLDTHNAITWNNKGLVLLKLNRLSQSVECFDKAIENNKGYAKAWYNKGRALSMLSRTDESQKCFDTARKLDPLLFTKLRRMK